MRIDLYIHVADPEAASLLRALDNKLDIMTETIMATQTQIDALKADVAALIQEAVADITAAVAAAQSASPDPAIDTLDANVKEATQTLKDAAAKLVGPLPQQPA